MSKSLKAGIVVAALGLFTLVGFHNQPTTRWDAPDSMTWNSTLGVETRTPSTGTQEYTITYTLYEIGTVAGTPAIGKCLVWTKHAFSKSTDTLYTYEYLTPDNPSITRQFYTPIKSLTFGGTATTDTVQAYVVYR